MTEILVLCPFDVDRGLIWKAAELADGHVRALVPADGAETAAEYGAAAICILETGDVADEAAFSEFLAQQISRWKSDVVLASATVRMKNIMPMLAWRLHAGLTADCTALRLEGGLLIQTRPAFGSSLMADIRSQSRIQMATIRPGTFQLKRHPNLRPIVETLTYQMEERLTLSAFRRFTEGQPLSQAEVIISGGMGVGSRAGFQKLGRLAEKLGAGLGASRPAVNAGFAPHRCQVGMTGITVSPRRYVAVGISGAVQHLAGMSGSGKIIAINSDPGAPVFDYADFGIVGDWEMVIDRLLEEETL